MDPLTILGTLKMGLAAGKSVHSLSKEIGAFFDSVDGAKRKHQKKKESPFASANEEALATWAEKENAKVAEEQLREWVCNNKGWDSWQSLLVVRRQVLEERKEQERMAKIEAERHRENVETIAVAAFLAVILAGFAFAALVFFEVIDPRRW